MLFVCIFVPAIKVYVLHHPQEIARLKQQLAQPLPGRAAQELMTGRVLPLPETIPGDARPSAVLALIFSKQEELHVLLMRRTEDGRAHSGQISFPGGKQEQTDADLTATALREAQEEAGVLSGNVNILGALTSLYIPVSNFMVYPFVGYSERPPDYNLSEDEVAEILEIPLSRLFGTEHKIITTVRPSSAPGMQFTVPAYLLPDDSFIWGATAMILSELEVIWKTANG